MNTRWKKVRLGDVAIIESGGTPSTRHKEYWVDGDIFWATLPDLKAKYIYSTQRKITKLGLEQSSAKLLPVNTVIYSSRATIGEIAISKVPVSTNQGSKNFICNEDKITPEFLYYLLKVLTPKILNLASGATYKEVSKAELESLEINIPERRYQDYLVTVISKYDELIINNQRRIELNESLGRLLYEKCFINNNENSSIKSLEIEDEIIPSEWNMLPIKDAIDINPSIEYKNGSSIKHLGMSGLSETLSVIDLKQLEIKNKSTGVKFQNNDVLLARITPCLQNGKTAFVQFLNQDEVATGSTEFIVLRQKILPSSYIYYLARDQRFREAAQYAMVGASGRQRIHASFFDKYRVIVPPQQLLDAFDNKVLRLLKYSAKLNEQNSVLIEMRDLLIELLINRKKIIK